MLFTSCDRNPFLFLSCQDTWLKEYTTLTNVLLYIWIKQGNSAQSKVKEELESVLINDSYPQSVCYQSIYSFKPKYCICWMQHKAVNCWVLTYAADLPDSLGKCWKCSGDDWPSSFYLGLVPACSFTAAITGYLEVEMRGLGQWQFTWVPSHLLLIDLTC